MKEARWPPSGREVPPQALSIIFQTVGALQKLSQSPIPCECFPVVLMFWFILVDPPPFRRPMVTGTSVVAVTFADGVMMAADTLGEEVLPYFF